MNVSDSDAHDRLERLAARHDQFIGFLAKRVGDRDVAEDLLQTAFLKAAERQDQVRNDESSVAWFYRLLRNAIVDHFRRQDVEQRGAARLAGEDSTQEPDDFARDIACQCVLAVLPSVKPEYAEMLRRVDVEEGSLADVAAESGIAPGNARVRLHRARAALKKEVQQICRTCAEHACVDCHCRN